MLKTKQNQRKIFNLVKLILFVGVLWIVYSQISDFSPDAWKEFSLLHPFSFVLAILLVYPNIWLVYRQWKVTLNVVAPQTSRFMAIQSFFAGIVTGIVTPNMVGNFIGRFYYFDRSKRAGIILFTLLSNYAAFLATFTFGWIAILVAGDLIVLSSSRSFLIGLGTGVIIAFLIYFFIENFLYRIRRKGYLIRFRNILHANRLFRSKILGLSLARFVVFTMQFALVLHAFGETIDVLAIMAIWQVYLLAIVIPSLFLGNLGVRESIALLILGGIGMNEFAVLFASLIIWTINTLSPALIGLVICKKPVEHAV